MDRIVNRYCAYLFTLMSKLEHATGQSAQHQLPLSGPGPGPPEPRLKHSILIQSANTTHSQWSELGPATVHSSHGHTLHTGKTGGHTHITNPEGQAMLLQFRHMISLIRLKLSVSKEPYD